MPGPEPPWVGGPDVNAGVIGGGGPADGDPERCVVDIDRRLLPGEDDPAAVLAPFRRVIGEIQTDHPEVRIDVAIREWTDAAEASPDERIVRLARAAVAEADARPPPPARFTCIT